MIEKAVKAGVPELEEPKSPGPSQKVEQVFVIVRSYLTKGKIIALSVIFLIFIVSYLGLILFSQQTPENNNAPTTLKNESIPTTENNLPETELAKKIWGFSQKITEREDYMKNLSLPSVDLNLDF